MVKHTQASWNLWAAANSVPNLPDGFKKEWEKLSPHIRFWAPDYDVGDRVIIRPGTLGNVDRRDEGARIVAGFFWSGSHLCTQLKYPFDEHKFVASTYLKAR